MHFFSFIIFTDLLSKITDPLINFFFLNYPSPGSPLVLFEQIAGNPGYIALTLLLVLVVWIILYLPFYSSTKHRVREAYSLPARK